MKTAIWTSRAQRCGIAAYSDALAAELRALGLDIDLVPVPGDDRSSRLQAELLERLNSADLIHIQHEYSFWGGIAPGKSSLPVYLKRLRKPRVTTAHTVFTTAELLRTATEERPRQRAAKELLSRYRPFRRQVEAAPFAGSRAVIVHTREARERLIRWKFAPSSIHVIPAGIPQLPPPSEADLQRIRQQIGDAQRVVSLPGFVNRDKGYELVLEALRTLPRGIRLLIAGGSRTPAEESYLDALEERIRRMGLQDRTVVTGYLSEGGLAAAMQLSDLVLAPHTSANGSYSVLLAVAAGRPVLASNLACFREIAEEGCAETFDSGDETMLAERMGYLLASSSARDRLAAAAREYAARRTWRAAALRTIEIYRTSHAAGG